MQRHVRTYHCSHQGCNLAFFRQCDPLRHVKTKHEDLTRDFCPYDTCRRYSYGFTCKDKLAEHVRKLHLGSSTTTEPPEVIRNPGSVMSELRVQECCLDLPRVSAIQSHGSISMAISNSDDESSSQAPSTTQHPKYPGVIVTVRLCRTSVTGKSRS